MPTELGAPSGSPARRGCACADDEAYACWAARYDLCPDDPQAIDADGGPCECGCHGDAAEIDLGDVVVRFGPARS